MTLDELIRILDKKHQIIVGFPKDKQTVYPPSQKLNSKGEPINKGGQTVAQVATWNEFGTKTKKGTVHSPARPFLNTAYKKNRALLRKLISLSFSPENIINPYRYDIIGLEMVTMVKNSIDYGDWVKNKPYTRRMKLTTETKKLLGKKDEKSKAIVADEYAKMKPLIDRSIMKGAVSYEVSSS